MRIFFLMIFGMSVLTTVQAEELYSITDLGPGVPVGINNAGTVLGRDSGGSFLYEGGQKQYLPQPAGGTFTAGAINDTGVVVGSTNFGSGAQYYLTTYFNGTLTVNTALPDLDPIAVNNAGQIAGVEPLRYRSFLYSGGTLTTIPNQLNVTEPVVRAINSSGVVTGTFSPSSSSPQQSFMFANGQFTPLAIPAVYSTVGGINDSGVIAGSYGFSSTSLNTAGVFTWDATGLHSLGPAFGELSGEADFVGGINNAGVIAGGSYVPNQSNEVAWVYMPGSGFMDLNNLVSANSGWDLLTVLGLNNAGDMIGMGAIDGRDDVFLLTPVPEPGTALLFIAAMIASLCRARRKKRPNGAPGVIRIPDFLVRS